jgi:NADH:ubiquinone oxidoreductase subunit 6 (subunit J)
LSLSIIIFYFFTGLAAVSALSMVFIKNVYYAALLLIVCLLSLAGIYIVAFAEFVAVTQILIYAGGILVLIIFGIMLTAKISGKPLVVEHQYQFVGTAVGIIFFILLATQFANASFYQKPISNTSSEFTSINTIGILMMSDYVLPFEVVGVLLLIALLGAAVVASSFKSIKK